MTINEAYCVATGAGLYDTFPGTPDTFPGHIGPFPGIYLMEILIFKPRSWGKISIFPSK